MGDKMEAQSFNWVEESNELMRPSNGRKRKRPKRKEFVGWGSRELIGFLNAIGKGSKEKLSQHDVTSIVNQYINDNGLLNPAKKKRVLCDGWLQALFGRKTIARIKIFELLESHYAENADSDDGSYSSDEREGDKHAGRTPPKDLAFDEIANKRNKACAPPPNAPAAIIPENIKAVYLRRTLVEKLLKDPDTFESKVLGSYVRVKADRFDYKQKNSHVLQLVAGIIKDAADGGNVRLEIAEMGKHINISELSEVEFSEVECQDLHRRMIEDFLKQPTVAELQEKVQVLHEDITKDWLPRELNRLECRMDRANEKGWRGEFFECRDKRKLLQTPTEVARLLENIPEVVAEKPKVDPVPENTEDCSKKATSDSPTVIDWVISNGQLANGGAKPQGGADLKGQELEPPKVEAETIIQLEPPRVTVESAVKETIFEAVTNGNILSFDLNEQNNGVGSSPKQTEVIDLNQSFDSNEMNTRAGSLGKQAEVIDLSDDEEDKIPPDSLEEIAWHYMDPQGRVQGPFPLMSMKRWSDLNYFPQGFTVWKSGQSREQEVFLSELLRQMFPH